MSAVVDAPDHWNITTLTHDQQAVLWEKFHDTQEPWDCARLEECDLNFTDQCEEDQTKITFEEAMSDLSLEDWKRQVSTISSFREFREGPCRDVCQGDVCPSGGVLRALDKQRDVPATFALLGPYHDDEIGDDFYGVPAYWIDKNCWQLSGMEEKGADLSQFIDDGVKEAL
jgi:hypothetical protein